MKLRTPEEILIKGVKLSKILEEHNLWLSDSSKGKRANLSGADLSEANLSGANLSKANLSEANFFKANLSGAILYRADLSGACLTSLSLSYVNFCEADLFRANLSGANLSKANLSEADCSKVNLSGANLHEANLHDANLHEATLSRANLSRANLSNAYFSKTKLFGAILVGANLSKAHLTKVNLSEVDLSKADFRYSSLTNVNLSRVNFLSVATNNWTIKNITCEFIYFDYGETERYPKERNFEDGEFEKLYRAIPTIEVIFENGYDVLDHLAAPFLASYMESRGSETNLVFISIDNKGIFPTATYQVPPETDTKVALQEAEKYIEELKNDKQYLQKVLLEAINNSGKIQVHSNQGNLAIGGSTITDNRQNITIEKIENLIEEIDRAPELQGDNKSEEKDTFKDSLKKCLGDIRKGALGQAGKTLMEETIKKGIEVAPSIAPLALQVLHSI